MRVLKYSAIFIKVEYSCEYMRVLWAELEWMLQKLIPCCFKLSCLRAGCKLWKKWKECLKQKEMGNSVISINPEGK